MNRTFPSVLPRWVTGSLVWMCAFAAVAEFPPESLLTAGTTRAADPDGAAWVYVAWTGNDPVSLRGRVLAIYARPGEPAAGGAWERKALVFPASPLAETLAPLIARGAQLGEDPADLAAALGALIPRADVTAATAPEARLAAALSLAAADPAVAAAIDLLAARFHAVTFALGRAWADRLPVGPVTLEVRDFDPGTGKDRSVVARLQIDSGHPVPLPAPDPPRAAPPVSSADDLRVALLWSEPDALLRRSPLLGGFDVWRMPAAAARAAGWDAQSPRVKDLEAQGARVNNLPIVPRTRLKAAEAAALAMDPANAFLTDTGPGEPAWRDGDEFAWFVVPRDRLGQPGTPSLGGFGFVCAAMPPGVPRGVTAVNTFDEAAAPPRPQRISLEWEAGDEAAAGTVSRFEVYRGDGELPKVVSTNAVPPGMLLGTVPFDGKQGQFGWIDGTLHPEIHTNLYGHAFWYSVRAIRDTKCGPIASAPSPPVVVNVRRFDAPDAPVGELGINCPRVVVLPPDPNFHIDRLDPPDPGDRHYRIVLQRRDRGVAWVDLSVMTGLEEDPQRISPRLRFAEEDAEAVFDFRVTRLSSEVPAPVVRVVAGSFTGAESPVRGFELPGEPGVDLQVTAVVPIATVSPEDFRPGDPFYAGLLEGPFLLSDVTLGADGMLRARSPVESDQVVIEAAPPGTDPNGDWRFVTITRPLIFLRTDGAWLVFADPQLPSGADIGHTLAYRAWILRPEDRQIQLPCAHVARPADSEFVQPMKVRVFLTPRTRQWRVFRRVDDGALTLIAEGISDAVPRTPQSVVEATDDAMPPGAARICYFGQAADENGNWSPLGPLGCEDVLPPVPPVPLLARPEAEGDATAPVMRLHWFCPPSGVHTFQIILRNLSGSPPEQGKSLATSALKALWVNAPHQVTWFSKSALEIARQGLTVSSTLATGPVGTEPPGAALGDGPDFSFAVDVVPDTKYEVQVVAVDVRGNAGPASAIQRFTWKTPRAVADRDVPWPRRPLPGVQAISTNIEARLVSDFPIVWPIPTNSCGVGMRIGTIPLGARELIQGLIGPLDGEHGGRLLRLLATIRARQAGRTLESFLFPDEVSDPARPDLRADNVVLYRQQLPSDEFPTVSGDVIQVSSLFRRIAAWPLPDGAGFEWLDPALALTLHVASVDPAVGNTRPAGIDIHLLDLHPVVHGARYRYWMVHFDALGEPDQTIPAGEVEVPL